MEETPRYMNKHESGPFAVLGVSDVITKKLMDAGYKDFTELMYDYEKKAGFPIDDAEHTMAEKADAFFRVTYGIPGITQEEANELVRALTFIDMPKYDA